MSGGNAGLIPCPPIGKDSPSPLRLGGVPHAVRMGLCIEYHSIFPPRPLCHLEADGLLIAAVRVASTLTPRSSKACGVGGDDTRLAHCLIYCE